MLDHTNPKHGSHLTNPCYGYIAQAVLFLPDGIGKTYAPCMAFLLPVRHQIDQDILLGREWMKIHASWLVFTSGRIEICVVAPILMTDAQSVCEALPTRFSGIVYV